MTQTDPEQNSQPREPRTASSGGVSINIGSNISGSQPRKENLNAT